MEHRLKAIAVDDEFRALEVVERYIKKIPFMDLQRSFKNPLNALEFIKAERVDLIFLDINMPDLSGTALAKLLKNDQQVVFTTAYSEFALEGFELDATDYLLKPIDFERFLKACLKAKEQFELKRNGTVLSKDQSTDEKSMLLLKSAGRVYRVDINAVLFFEKLGNDLLTYLEDGAVIKSRLNMKELFALLPQSGFAQTHKSFVVASGKVDVIENHQVHIRDHQVPIGRSYREGLMELLSLK